MFNRSNNRINYFKYLFRSFYQSSSSPYYYGYGRTALKAGLISHNITKGKEVLVPDYICDAAVDPFNELKIEISYYSVNEDLSPDWNSISKQLSKNTCAIMMVHYFGIAQDIDRYIKFSRENNLLLIEDNSHGYGGTYNKKLLGEFGDIGISSPRKSFPILNGGMLFLKNEKQVPLTDLPKEPANIPKMIIKNMAGKMLDLSPFIKNILLKNHAENNSASIQDFCIDKSSFDILTAYSLSEVSNIRTQVYKVWEKWSKKNHLTPVFSIHIYNNAPMAFPLIFDNIEERDEWLTIFKKNYVAAFIWPDLPKEIANTENSGYNLRNRILCLPIHLSMNAEKLEEFLFNKFTRSL